MKRLATFALLLPAVLPAAAALSPHPAEVVQPRAFGYQLGDVLEQRIRLEADGKAFVTDQLPPLERVGNWFARRSAARVNDERGTAWLVVRYQLINAPARLQVVSLPDLILEAADRGPGLRVAAWPVSVAPLGRRDAFSEPGLGELRPDRPPATPPLGPLAARLQLTLAALAAMLAAWLGWWLWRSRHDRSTLPFARAWATIRPLGDDDPQAWRALHRAFDAGAGSVVDAASVDRLFAQRPELAPLADDISRFYRASAQRFFAGRAVDGISPRKLCRALMHIERRHAG
ncbi:MAG: hypothetical protein KDH15_03410 [Rhodocyclaceae bacterium]|nr:hypothetical protein [Rhodocyclaceae bacterium]